MLDLKQKNWKMPSSHYLIHLNAVNLDFAYFFQPIVLRGSFVIAFKKVEKFV